jgi:hypothetical protein
MCIHLIKRYDPPWAIAAPHAEPNDIVEIATGKKAIRHVLDSIQETHACIRCSFDDRPGTNPVTPLPVPYHAPHKGLHCRRSNHPLANRTDSTPSTLTFPGRLIHIPKLVSSINLSCILPRAAYPTYYTGLCFFLLLAALPYHCSVLVGSSARQPCTTSQSRHRRNTITLSRSLSLKPGTVATSAYSDTALPP